MNRDKMRSWQEPENGYRLYLIDDNTKMEDFLEHVREADKNRIQLSLDNEVINLGIHYYKKSLHSSNYVGISRVYNTDGDPIQDEVGNTILLKVVPRFHNIRITDLLNYIREDDEFDRYLTPQTNSNSVELKYLDNVEHNEIFTFFDNELPIRVNDEISNEISIITVTVFLCLLQRLCRKPLMGRMIKTENNLVGKVKGKIIIEKNISNNTIHGRNDRFYCSYLHYTDNIKENQILKAAFKIAKRFVNDYFSTIALDNSVYTKLISYCTNSLKHISDISCKSEDCVGLKFSGCYTHYRPVMTMAKMIFENISVDHTGTASPNGYAIPYAISMDKLFEVYVRAYLKRNNIKSYKSIANSGIRLEKFDKKIDVFSEKSKGQKLRIAGPIKPDILLTPIGTNRNTVFDVKYKELDSGGMRIDRLQLLAYSMLLNADNIGLILPSSSKDLCVSERIDSQGDRDVVYHQIQMKITSDDGLESSKKTANYIKRIVGEKPNKNEKRILIQYKISTLQKIYNDLLSLMSNENKKKNENKEKNENKIEEAESTILKKHIAELEILKEKYEKGKL